MKKAKETAMASGKDSVNCNHLLETTNKKRGQKKKGKVLNLISRLDKYQASV